MSGPKQLQSSQTNFFCLFFVSLFFVNDIKCFFLVSESQLAYLTQVCLEIKALIWLFRKAAGDRVSNLQQHEQMPSVSAAEASPSMRLPTCGWEWHGEEGRLLLRRPECGIWGGEMQSCAPKKEGSSSFLFWPLSRDLLFSSKSVTIHTFQHRSSSFSAARE